MLGFTMTLQSTRQRFLSLLHPTMEGHVDLYVPLDPQDDDQRCALELDKATVDLANTHLLSGGTPPSAEHAKVAFRALSEMINGHAPEYWRNARSLLRAQKEPGAAKLSEEALLDAEVLCVLGWMDRRIGTRSLDQDIKENGYQAFSPLEGHVRSHRLQLFNSPSSSPLQPSRVKFLAGA
jgi:hypothetical protein